jgi:hypothetical protein
MPDSITQLTNDVGVLHCAVVSLRHLMLDDAETDEPMPYQTENILAWGCVADK